MIPSLNDIFKLVLWTLGIVCFFTALLSKIWWPFVTIITIFLHLQVPIPLAFCPPVFDGSINGFVVKFGFIIGSFCIVLGLVFEHWWFIPAMFCFYKRFVLSYEAEETIARFRRLTPSVGWDEQREYPRLPLLLYLHPYLLNYVGHLDLGGGVRIRRVAPDSVTACSTGSSADTRDPPPITLTTSFDLWYQENNECAGNSSSHPQKKKPLFFFVHGGGWIFGESRRHTQVLLLQRLVLHGFVVVAANYRKIKWPQHIDDCENTLRYLIQEADRYGIDVDQIVVSGASAGGQIAALLQLRLQATVSRIPHTRIHTAVLAPVPVPVPKLAGMVLFYPVTDPADDCGATYRFPFPLPFLHYKSRQSLLHWFFEYYALKGDSTHLHSASPLRLLADSDGLIAAKLWPPTLILAGDLDGIVPLEGDVMMLNLLESYRQRAMVRLESTSSSNSNSSSSSSSNSSGESGKYRSASSPLVDSSHTYSSYTTTTHHATATSSTNSKIFASFESHSCRLGDPSYHRPQDSLLVVPGAKHIFEAGGGAIVDVTCSGVIAWLEQQRMLAEQ